MTSRRLLSLLAAALIAAACNGGDEDDDNTPTAAPSPTTAAATAEPTPSSEIRGIDLAGTEPVQTAVADTGGTFVATDVLYADLTEDAIEDAVAPISSGGSAGNVAVTILTPAGSETVDELLRYDARVGGGLVANVVDGQLVLTEPAPGPDDAECCPSELRTIIYVWDGDSLEVESETTSPNPQGDSKTPTSS